MHSKVFGGYCPDSMYVIEMYLLQSIEHFGQQWFNPRLSADPSRVLRISARTRSAASQAASTGHAGRLSGAAGRA